MKVNWLRELGGWLLVLAGLVIFTRVYSFCQNRWPVEAVVLLVMGIFVFRGGINLLKTAVAARVVQEARESPSVPARPVAFSRPKERVSAGPGR